MEESMLKRIKQTSNSESQQERADGSSELASLGGYSNCHSLLVEETSPEHDKSQPVLHEGFSSIIEEDGNDLGPQTEIRKRESTEGN